MHISIAFFINVKKIKTKIFNALRWVGTSKIEMRYTINNKIKEKNAPGGNQMVNKLSKVPYKLV